MTQIPCPCGKKTGICTQLDLFDPGANEICCRGCGKVFDKNIQEWGKIERPKNKPTARRRYTKKKSVALSFW